MNFTSSSSREELLAALEDLRAEQRRIDNAIAVVEVFLRTERKPDLTGIARYQPPDQPNAKRPQTAGKKATKAVGVLIPFPVRVKPALQPEAPRPSGTDSKK